ncbi:MAG: hypothetical protein K2J20_04355 [Bacilli bacterium]|nr:hypothetical protein [Bacilli bacterium]
MDGKLLILCDEKPGDYEKYSVKDIYYLRSVMIDPQEDPERLFVCWDSIIPSDRSFIEACMRYGTFQDKMPVDFPLKQTGMTDGKHGTIKGSIQEESCLNAVRSNIQILRETAQKGGDVKGEAMDLAVQFPMQATQWFIEAFSEMLNQKNVVRILLAHRSDVNPELVRYRMRLLEAWENHNGLMREKASGAKLVEPMIYEDFGQLYSRSGDEMMEIYSLPIFGETSEERKPN